MVAGQDDGQIVMKKELPITMEDRELDLIDDLLWVFFVVMSFVGMISSLACFFFVLNWIIRSLA